MSGAAGTSSLPHSDSAECAALGAVLLDNGQFPKLAAILVTEDFYSDRHRRIFRACARLTAGETALDLVTLRDELERTGELDDAGGLAYLTQLVDGVARSANVGHYVRIVKEKAARRAAMAESERLAHVAGNGSTPEEFAQAIRESREILAGLEHGAEPASTWRSVPVESLLVDETTAIPWLIDRLVARQEVEVLTAPPKSAKTWVILALAVHAAVGRPIFGRYAVAEPLRVLFADEEMGAPKIRRRLKRLVRALSLSFEERGNLSANLLIYPQQGLTLTTDEGIAELRRAVESFRPDLIILDSFAAFTSGIDDTNPARRAFYVRALAPLKTNFNLAILLTAHPPLPAKEQAADAQKRPRGGGDILAVVDRAFYLEKVSEEVNDHGKIVISTLGELFSREGGGLEEPVAVHIEDVGPAETVVRAETGSGAGAVAALGKISAAQREALELLRLQPDAELYQPTLKADLATKGFGRDTIQSALNGLAAQGVVEIRPPRGKQSGKWVGLGRTEAEE